MYNIILQVPEVCMKRLREGRALKGSVQCDGCGSYYFRPYLSEYKSKAGERKLTLDRGFLKLRRDESVRIVVEGERSEIERSLIGATAEMLNFLDRNGGRR